MRIDGFIGNSRFANQILKCDAAYVESIAKNYFGENLQIKAEKVLNSWYPKPEFTCDLCGAGNKRKSNRPACFYPTPSGYIYTCMNCNPCMTLNQFLRHLNPSVAEDHSFDRWVNGKLTGRGFNAPEPPKNRKKEHYQNLEQQLKEKNKREYQRKHGLPEE